MDKLVRKIEVPLARKAIEKAGLYLVQEKDLKRLAEVAASAYEGYPLHNWFTGGKYDKKASELIMQISLKTMTKDAVIYADSEEINGFAVWLPFGFTGSKTLPFLLSGGLRLILHSGPGIIGRLLTYETYAMNLKKEFTDHYDWYLFNLSIKKDSQGKGIASKLMRPMIQFCDDERMVAYLETNKETNVGLYQHYGFELMKEEMIPKSPVTHYAMVRKPIEQVIWELPAGKLEIGESPKECAIRELKEETGYSAKNLKLLHKFFTSAGFSNQKIYIFLATGLTKGEPDFDDDEFIEIHCKR